MPVVGLLTTLTQMSTHRSGIQGTKGAWGRVGAGASLSVDYIPAKGSALPVPNSKNRINHPHAQPV